MRSRLLFSQPVGSQICFILIAQANQSLLRVDLSWNGFGFEGCVALGDMLARNRTLKELDISSNRIHPPALLEVSRGLARNKTLQVLKVGVFLNVRGASLWLLLTSFYVVGDY